MNYLHLIKLLKIFKEKKRASPPSKHRLSIPADCAARVPAHKVSVRVYTTLAGRVSARGMGRVDEDSAMSTRQELCVWVVC